MKAKGWSIPHTARRVFAELEALDWTSARVCDVGAGRGAFSKLVGDWLVNAKHVDPRAHLFACDLIPASFEYDGVACARTNADGTLPFPDAHFDATVSIEVVEHVEDQFAFLRELVRVTKPGGKVIVTTPNVLNMNSRVRTLLTGFPALFDPLPLATSDPRLLGGHIHPISPYFLAYDALRAGLVRPRLVHDRTKSSSAALAVLAGPALLAGRAWHTLRLKRKRPALWTENRELLAAQHGWRMLTSRTTVLVADKPRS
ncbi:MAG: class I SAM-dependent methyltransferase [Planctomycetes bacterium]|nr:class I SAM-dependent methyltransferase [Planctomycetota bacterium]